MAATALWFTGPRSIESRPVDVGSPNADEVVVETRLSAISAGTELLLYRDQMPTDLRADETLESVDGDLSYPRRYGYATVGEVIETGDAVPAALEGRRVFAFHPHQTRFRTTVDELVRLPPELPSGACAVLPSMETAVTLTLDANPRLHERVIVFGAGPVGLCSVDLLAGFPLAELHVVDPLAQRRDRARALGADRVSPTSDDEAEFDIAVEVSGDPSALDDAIGAVAYHGRVIVGSWYGTKRAELELGRRFHRDRVSVHSSQVSTIEPALRGRWTRTRRLEVTLERLGELTVDRLITHRIPFAEAERAYRLLDESPDEAIQILLTYS